MNNQIQSFMSSVSRLCKISAYDKESLSVEAKKVFDELTAVKSMFSVYWNPIDNAIDFVFRCINGNDEKVIIQAALQRLLQTVVLFCGSYSFGVSVIRDTQRCLFNPTENNEMLSEKVSIVFAMSNVAELNKNKENINQFVDNGYSVVVLLLSKEAVAYEIPFGITVYRINDYADIPMVFDIAFYASQSEFFVLLLGFLPKLQQIDIAVSALRATPDATFIQFESSEVFADIILWESISNSVSGIYRRRLIEKIGALDILFSSEQYLAEDFCERAKRDGYIWGTMPLRIKNMNIQLTRNDAVDRDIEALLRKYGKLKSVKADTAFIASYFAEISVVKKFKNITIFHIGDEVISYTLRNLLIKKFEDINISICELCETAHRSYADSDCAVFATPIGRIINFEHIISDILNDPRLMPNAVFFYDENYLSADRLVEVLSDAAGSTNASSIFTIWHRKNLRSLIEDSGFTTTLTRVTKNIPHNTEKFVSNAFSYAADAIFKNIMTTHFIYACIDERGGQ